LAVAAGDENEHCINARVALLPTPVASGEFHHQRVRAHSLLYLAKKPQDDFSMKFGNAPWRQLPIRRSNNE